MFYFERFMDHDRGMKLTITEEQERVGKRMKSDEKSSEQDIEGKVQRLHDEHGFAIIELQFLYDALRQVRACRRVLKWTYVYGYYLDDSNVPWSCNWTCFEITYCIILYMIYEMVKA